MSAEHIKAFMLKKAPPPAAKQAKLVPHRPESESIVSYPKDVTNTVLLKHLNMRMAIGGQTFENMEKPKIYGRKKSDITVHGALYERSYQ